MFSSSRRKETSFSKHRAGKTSSFSQAKKQRSFRGANIKTSQRFEQAANEALRQQQQDAQQAYPSPQTAGIDPIITLAIGPQQRLFAAHSKILAKAPYFAHLLRNAYYASGENRIELPDEEPEIFSCILEFMYKGDYSPRIVAQEDRKKRRTWTLDYDNPASPISPAASVETLVYSPTNNSLVSILKDTIIYCTAQKYGMEELQRIALRKQGLQSGVQCSTILNSARYAYEHTHEADSKLRAHYLALIIRSRSTFKRSGTMQTEMEAGGKLWFDLFVAMVNHMDDLSGPGTPASRRTC